MPISTRLDFRPWSRVDSITNRTAVYGPVRTVVWEGRRSDTPPYPDRNRLPHHHRISGFRRVSGEKTNDRMGSSIGIHTHGRGSDWYSRSPLLCCTPNRLPGEKRYT